MKFFSMLMILLLFACNEKRHSNVNKRQTPFSNDSTGKIASGNLRIEEKEGERTYLVEDISRNEYEEKKASVDTIRNGSIEAWPMEMLNSIDISKKDSCLSFLFDNKTTARFCDSASGDDFRGYNPIGFIKEIGCFCIYVDDNYGHDILLLNKKNGDQNYLGNFPALSPKRKRYMVCSYDMIAFNVYNGFEIGTIENGDFNPEMKIDGGKQGNWGADSPIWISENVAIFLRKTMDEKAEHETVRYSKVTIK